MIAPLITCALCVYDATDTTLLRRSLGLNYRADFVGCKGLLGVMGGKQNACGPAISLRAGYTPVKNALPWTKIRCQFGFKAV